MLIELNNPNINSVNATNLQCGTRYNFTVVVNTTTFINESNTAVIHLRCPPSPIPSKTQAPTVSTRPSTTPSPTSTPPGEPNLYSIAHSLCMLIAIQSMH